MRARQRFRRCLFARCFFNHAGRGVHFGLAVGEHCLHQLEFSDGLVELLSLERVASGIFDEPLPHPLILR